MKSDPHPWAADLPLLHVEVWACLIRGVHDRHAPARHPTLSTVSAQGRPQTRTVILRAANKSAGTLDIHTDLRSAKVGEIYATPFAAIHVWDRSAHLQIRLEADVAVLSGLDVTAIWEGLHEASRKSYGSMPAPGQPIGQSLDYVKEIDPKHFAVLRLSVLSIDALHLGPNHRRANFNSTDNWAGAWLAP